VRFDDVRIRWVDAAEAAALGAEDEHGRARAGDDVIEMRRCDGRQLAPLDEVREALDGRVIQRANMTFDEPIHARPVELALLRDDAVQLRVMRGEEDELPHDEARGRQLVDAAQAVGACAQRVGELLEQRVGRGTPQRVFRLEVVVEQRLCHSGARRDLARGRAFERTLGEQVERGRKYPLPGGIGRRACRPSCCAFHTAT
jgi:hypothetical protein